MPASASSKASIKLPELSCSYLRCRTDCESRCSGFGATSPASEVPDLFPNPAPSWGRSPRCKRPSRPLPRIEESTLYIGATERFYCRRIPCLLSQIFPTRRRMPLAI